jgi:M6 family metalloprotease-like protein
MRNVYRVALCIMLTVLLSVPSVPAFSPEGRPVKVQPPFFLYRDAPMDFSKANPSPDIAAPRVSGDIKIIILCIEFSDIKHGSSNTPTYFDDMADGNTNSMKLYYREASYSKINISSDAGGWYTSTQTMAYYGTPSGGENDNPSLYKLVTEALVGADASINFSQYDVDLDGWIDYLIIIHAGGDQAMTQNANDIWSHKYYNLDTPTVDGKKVGWYSMISENDPMGVMAHEYGHQLGLPDLYDTDYTGSGGETCGAGIWDVMAMGSYANYGVTPSLPSAWSRIQLGWANVINITQSTSGLTIKEADLCNTVVRVNFPGLSSEYFLIENRQLNGYDSSIAGSGILIWHIDELQGSPEVNNMEVRPGKMRVTLEEAHGGTQHMQNAMLNNWGDYGDTWKSNGAGFNPVSSPNSTAQFDGRHSFISIKSITQSSSQMTFDVQLNTPVFDLRLTASSTTVKADPGSTTPYTVTLRNFGSPDTFTITLEGSHLDWFTANPASVTLDARAEDVITVNIKPPYTTPANTTSPNTFKASALSDPSKYSFVGITTTVNQKYRSTVGPSQDINLLPGERRSVNLTLSNMGNVADTVALTFTGDGVAWVEYTGATSIPLGPWKNTTLELKVVLPWGTQEGAKSYVVVGGHSKDNSVTTPATINFTVLSAPAIEFEGPAEMRVKPSVSANWGLKLTNAGTSDANLVLSATADQGWYANLTQSAIGIPAWTSQDTTITITPPPNTVAGTRGLVNLTATTGFFTNSTSLLCIVDQLYSARIAEGNTTAQIMPGTTYEYKLTLENTGNGLDSMKFSVAEGEGGTGWAENLDLSSASVAAGAKKALVLTVTAPGNAGAGQEWSLNLTVQHGDGNLTVFEMISRVARVGALTLSASTKAKAGLPGEDIQFSLMAGNNGNAPDTVVFSAPKIAGLKIEFGSPTLDIAVGGTASVIMTCKLDAAALAGVRFFNVTAASQSISSVNTTTELKLTVNAVFGSQLAFKETRKGCDAGKGVGFQFTVTNKGNSQDTFTFVKSSGSMSLTFDKSSVTLRPGESANLTVTVSVAGGESGGAKTVKLAVRSTGKGGDLETKELTVDVKAKGITGTPGFESQVLVLALCGVAILAYRRRIPA